MKATMGKILRVDLSTGKITFDITEPRYAQEYLGGLGLGLRLAYDTLQPDTEPFDPANQLIFMNGPVTATRLGTAGRFVVVFKSPLTGMLCDSSASGYWGSELKKSGFDGLIVTGKADNPVYLNIQDAQVEIRDACHLWTKDPFEVERLVKEETGNPKTSVMAIGIAGELGVRYASILTDMGRAVGRGGAGAVMGAKNLKAIAVHGSGEVELFDPIGFRTTALGVNRHAGTDPRFAGMRKYGTASGLDGFWPVGNVPTKNWQIGSYELICTELGGKRLNETFVTKHPACYRCPITCSRWAKIEQGPYQMDAPGPEYETLGALGTMCLVDDAESVSYAGHLCDIYGIDSISCGASIAFAMECYENGILTLVDTDGVELTWGNKHALVTMVEMIGTQKGVGELLGLGTRRMAELLGKDTADYAVHVKGLEAPMHDPRARFAWAVTYATSPRGACHLHGNTGIYEDKEDPIPEWGLIGHFPRHSNEGKGQMARLAQNWSAVISSMVICYFAAHTLRVTNLVELINTATGLELTPQDLLILGDRINNLYRAYNYRCGIRREHDSLPKRLLTPVAEGGAAGKVPDLEYQLKDYYRVRGWELDGKPGFETLVSLGLDDVARDLYG
jgi:aldehyde:ferredoxin oxidoreductase